MQSSSGINTVSKRAARAAGYSWGIAEEVGKCISSIEMFGIRGVENLNNYFKTIKDIKPEGPKQIEENNKLNDKSLIEWTNKYNFHKTDTSVAIIMAGNLPLAGFHDFICVLLSGNKIIVKPSSDDKILICFFIDFEL